ncbi:AAA family ATPase [Arthrobacter sp. RHLT1-20]
MVGENGSGKSTLVEAIALACGMSPEGGSTDGVEGPSGGGQITHQYLRPFLVHRFWKWGCGDSYCLRYRPAARRPPMVDTGMSHVGFRCAAPAAAP